MSERTEDQTRELEEESVEEIGVDDDFGVEEIGVDGETSTLDGSGGLDAGPGIDTAAETETARTGGIRGRVGNAFSPTSFALQLAGALVGTFVIGGAVPLGPLSGVVGVLVALFALGTVSTDARYVEAGTAGAIAGALTTVVTTVSLSLVSGGLLPVAGGIAGGAAALLGQYLGRDLRNGLTEDL